MRQNILLQTVLIFALGFLALAFYSCTKRSPNTILSPDEHINYTVNGVAYNFTIPADSVMSEDSMETVSFIPYDEVIGQRIPNATNDFARIAYTHNGIALGSMQQLNIFYTLQTGAYINNISGYLTTANPVIITITEYGAVGQYIAGNFTAVFTGPAPANISYNVDCDFRVKRKI